MEEMVPPRLLENRSPFAAQYDKVARMLP